MLITKKCDNGVPLPEGSTGTWFTWDVWDEDRAKSVSRHRSEDEATDAAQMMTKQPLLRDLIEHIKLEGQTDTAILGSLFAAYEAGHADGETAVKRKA
ncbi:MAG: hypothetical protein JWM74_1215 [Myxococcaceae bacterium]|nr:hypothetical protein [Myxococcaceae bacterium]